MTLYTEMPHTKSAWDVGYSDTIFLLGSCFAENIAKKMSEYFFNIRCNPNGTLYNPISVAHHMYTPFAQGANVFIITFGTAWVYILKNKHSGNLLDGVVDNCMKKPQSLFIRKRLTIEDIIQTWEPILKYYNDKKFIFTVSPIRHLKDGFHENQLSKSILLLSLERLIQKFGNENRVTYFPAYELVLDELRDYRFYADDLVHPSSLAIQCIWERFVETFLYDDTTKKEMRNMNQLYLDIHHRIINPQTPEAVAFQQKTQETLSVAKKKYTWINVTYPLQGE